jgi:hypothetical protein
MLDHEDQLSGYGAVTHPHHQYPGLPYGQQPAPEPEPFIPFGFHDEQAERAQTSALARVDELLATRAIAEHEHTDLKQQIMGRLQPLLARKKKTEEQAELEAFGKLGKQAAFEEHLRHHNAVFRAENFGKRIAVVPVVKHDPVTHEKRVTGETIQMHETEDGKMEPIDWNLTHDEVLTNRHRENLKAQNDAQPDKPDGEGGDFGGQQQDPQLAAWEGEFNRPVQPGQGSSGQRRMYFHGREVGMSVPGQLHIPLGYGEEPPASRSEPVGGRAPWEMSRSELAERFPGHSVAELPSQYSDPHDVRRLGEYMHLDTGADARPDETPEEYLARDQHRRDHVWDDYNRGQEESVRRGNERIDAFNAENTARARRGQMPLQEGGDFGGSAPSQPGVRQEPMIDFSDAPGRVLIARDEAHRRELQTTPERQAINRRILQGENVEAPPPILTEAEWRQRTAAETNRVYAQQREERERTAQEATAAAATRAQRLLDDPQFALSEHMREFGAHLTRTGEAETRRGNETRAQQQWLADHMGRLTPNERRQVETEMHATQQRHAGERRTEGTQTAALRTQAVALRQATNQRGQMTEDQRLRHEERRASRFAHHLERYERMATAPASYNDLAGTRPFPVPAHLATHEQRVAAARTAADAEMAYAREQSGQQSGQRDPAMEAAHAAFGQPAAGGAQPGAVHPVITPPPTGAALTAGPSPQHATPILRNLDAVEPLLRSLTDGERESRGLDEAWRRARQLAYAAHTRALTAEEESGLRRYMRMFTQLRQERQ